MPTGGGGGTFSGGTVPNATVFSSTVQIQSLGVGEAATGTTGDIQQTGALTTNGNGQIASLGVGVAADGTSGHITVPSSGTLRSSAGPLQLIGNNQNIDLNNSFLLRANWVGINTTTGPTGNALRLVPQLFASLPAASATYQGSIAVVSDSTTITWGATITGTGGNQVLAYCDGTNWTVAGK